MKEILNNLYIGNQCDYENDVKYKNDFFIVHACKEPYHRRAVNYIGRGAPKDHKEYLYAIRDKRLICNLVDADNAEYIPLELVREILIFIDKNISKSKVLVHCNQGRSRSAVIGMLFMKRRLYFGNKSFEEAEQEYIKIYPEYNPNNGMREFAKIYWNHEFITN